MAVNKATITINSRQYTVVAEESTEYIERLGNHVDEKVQNVLKGGQNILGERPVVLAALNICDEYFKALETDDYTKTEFEKYNKQIDSLERENKVLKSELSNARTEQIEIDEARADERLAMLKATLEEANNKIKFLEGSVQSLEKKLDEYKKNTVVTGGKR